ncbi:MAG: F-type H+-transporting ATPase subunit gamma [Chloroflexota bacterium]|nr:F-type H+-transporting ATPase subunit gamma [Chloroflexota bacterium]
MQLVAASKMRRAQQAVVASRPYADAVQTMLGELSQQRGDPSTVHPLLRVRPERRVAFVVFTSDRGLAGALNSNVIRRASEEVLARPGQSELVTVGRKGQDFFSRRGQHLTATFTGLGERADYMGIVPVARIIDQAYANETIDAVYLVYPKFVSTLTQQPTITKLLPIEPPEQHGTPLEFIIEPSPEDILEQLLPRYVEVQLFQKLLETTASEWSARLVAMRNATDNANDLIQSYTLSYNKARQAAITKEISEISGAAEALAAAG